MAIALSHFGTPVLVRCSTSTRYKRVAHTKPGTENTERDLAARGAWPPQILNGDSMKNLRRLLIIACGVILTALIPPSAMAQLNSNVGTVTLNATLPELLTVLVTGGTTVNFTLAANTAANPGSTTSTIQTAWVLAPGRTKVTVWAWVANGASALTDGAGDNIPASAVTATAAGSGSAGGALNTSARGGAGGPGFITPAAATGVQIGNVAITNANRASLTTTTLTWNINNIGVPQLPAATYPGTVNIQAQATP